MPAGFLAFSLFKCIKLGQIDLGEIEKAMAGWLASPPENLRATLTAWAAERGIDCD